MKEESYWILLSKKITGEISVEELRVLQQLINENAEWRTIIENLEELWNSKPVVTKTDRIQKCEDAYLAHISRLKENVPDFKETREIAVKENKFFIAPVKKPFYKSWISYAIAASLIAGIILLYPALPEREKVNETASLIGPVNEITINPGSRTKIQLPDGSQVWINSGSTLTYGNNFKGNTRDVQLEGEAYFEVVKDAEHPFIVHTSGIDIKVLGTSFNVKAYSIDPTIEATLIHGSIEVINKNQPSASKVMLKPHEKLIYSKYAIIDTKDQRADIKSVPDSFSIVIKPLKKEMADNDFVETAWVYNKLVFEDERFEDLALKMERWYNLKISFESERLKNYKISGSFIDETAEEAINELQLSVPFKYSIKNNEVKIMKK